MEIKNFINSLSKEEKVLHKSLIDECIKRENELNDISKITKESLKSFEIFVAQLEQLFDALKVLNKELELYHEETVPDENYYQYLN